MRCPYHGWTYDATGQCIEQPYEDRVNPEARYRDRIKIAGYQPRRAGRPDLVVPWAASGAVASEMGSARREPDLDREVNVFPLPCNWLRCMDNSVDPVRLRDFCTGEFGNYELEKQGRPPAMFPAQHPLEIAFDVYKYGIMKRRLLERRNRGIRTTGRPATRH